MPQILERENTGGLMIENILKTCLNDLVFIGIKKNKKLKIENYTKEDVFEVPILLSDIKSGVKEGNYSEEIGTKEILKAMGILLGVDMDFKYKSAYEDFIKTHIDKVFNFYKYMAKSLYEDGKVYQAYAILNYLKNKYQDDIEIKLIWAIVGESIYNENFENLSEKEKNFILKEIIKSYEEVIKLDKNNDIAHIKLGIINSNLKNYVKANLYFEKALNISKDDGKKEMIRSYLEEIESPARLEAAEAYIAYGKFDQALQQLERVQDKNQQNSTYYYYLSICQLKLGIYDEASINIDKAIDLEENPEYINHKALIKLSQNDKKSAIEIYKKAAEKGNDFTILYNLGVLYMSECFEKEALEAFKKAYEIKKDPELKKIMENIKIN